MKDLTALQLYRRTPQGLITNLYGKLKSRNLTKFEKPLPFSLKEFQDKYLNDEVFRLLFTMWEQKGFYFYDKPSIDRINPDKPYTFDNMQWMSWGENRKKGEAERGRITTSVAMFTTDGKFVKTFSSIKKASEETHCRQSGISSCCLGRYKTTGGMVFKYVDSGYEKTRDRIGNIHDKEEK